MTEPKNPFANNHLSLGSFFAVLAILCAYLDVTGYGFLKSQPFSAQPTAILYVVIALSLTLLFGWVAWGCVRRYKAARVAAELIASILVLRFPVIGAILAFLVIFPLAQWEPVRDDTHTPPPI